MFAGLLAYANAPRPEDWVDIESWHQALYPYFKPNLIGQWRQTNTLLVESQVFNTPWSHYQSKIPLQAEKLVVAFWGRLDNRLELAQKCGIDPQQLETLPDSHLVLKSWQRWGEQLLAHLLGDFAIAILDPEAKRLFLARDPLGVKPLYYWPHAQGVLFATTVGAFRCLKGLQPTPDRDWIARYLLRLSMCHSRTGYKEIFKLPPGHFLLVDREGCPELQSYHEWRDDAPQTFRRDPQWLAAYRHVLEDSIRCRMVSNYPLGTENSGGIDSATVTAYLARFLGDPGDQLHSFSFAFYDQEPTYILETSQHCNIVHNYLITGSSHSTKNDEERRTRTLQVLGYPPEIGNGPSYIPFYRECQLRRVRTLFSGFGGDEVVTSPGSLLRYELLDNHEYGALWDILPGHLLLRFLRFGKAVITGHQRPEYNPDFLKDWNERWPYRILQPDVVTNLGLDETYMETARYNAPYRRINDWIIKGQLKMPAVSTRFENCMLVAASYGIEYRWPLWDVRLVQQYLSTPSIEKVGSGGIGRYLHRRAISGTVPDRVAWKPNKDMGDVRSGNQKSNTDLQRIAEAANLHPILMELIDPVKWGEQIHAAQQENALAALVWSFSWHHYAIQWLNQWLSGG